MSKYFPFLITLFILSNLCFGQSSANDTIKVATIRDTSKYQFSAGFYLAIPDVSKAQGFRLVNSDDFYFVGTEYGITLRNIDTVYKEFDSNFKHYTLTFKFDSIGTKKLLDFTIKYQGQQVGLLVDNKLISIATIPSPIGYGVMTLYGNFTESDIDKLYIEIENAIIEIKRRRGTH